jgi:hypothetical protein
MNKSSLDRATQGKMASTKTVRVRRIRKEQLSSRTGIANLLIVCGAIQKQDFGEGEEPIKVNSIFIREISCQLFKK